MKSMRRDDTMSDSLEAATTMQQYGAKFIQVLTSLTIRIENLIARFAVVHRAARKFVAVYTRVRITLILKKANSAHASFGCNIVNIL